MTDLREAVLIILDTSTVVIDGREIVAHSTAGKAYADPRGLRPWPYIKTAARPGRPKCCRSVKKSQASPSWRKQ